MISSIPSANGRGRAARNRERGEIRKCTGTVRHIVRLRKHDPIPSRPLGGSLCLFKTKEGLGHALAASQADAQCGGMCGYGAYILWYRNVETVVKLVSISVGISAGKKGEGSYPSQVVLSLRRGL